MTHTSMQIMVQITTPLPGTSLLLYWLRSLLQ
ncbi:hypothetical protein Godav_010256 [Gossypium davidsonii]|uniref:Uncharacterized protein n=1 Tax=Gossypium davidsonii TaxID=34287 RepID=A0A7J8SFU9_GOSDV|nr:hypothetical protein [Gossypium davidsonii]